MELLGLKREAHGRSAVNLHSVDQQAAIPLVYKKTVSVYCLNRWFQVSLNTAWCSCCKMWFYLEKNRWKTRYAVEHDYLVIDKSLPWQLSFRKETYSQQLHSLNPNMVTFGPKKPRWPPKRNCCLNKDTIFSCTLFRWSVLMVLQAAEHFVKKEKKLFKLLALVLKKYVLSDTAYLISDTERCRQLFNNSICTWSQLRLYPRLHIKPRWCS